jgi:nicotinate-nucleotide adenylyltransferase
MRIGLFGGSFNPPHAGHRLVADQALRVLGLDSLWVLVTPGNPLKDNAALPSLDTRMGWTRAVMDDPRIMVTGFEAAIGTRYSHDTIQYLLRRCSGVRFVWIMGADSLAGFHRWQKWRQIVRMIPIAVIDRPGSTLRAPSAKMAQVHDFARVPETQAATLADRTPPAWVFLHGPRSDLSSTMLRNSPGLRTVSSR